MVSAEERDYVLEVGRKLFPACPEDCALPSVLAARNSEEQWLADAYIQIGACRNADYHGKGIDIFPSGKHHVWVNCSDHCSFRPKYSLGDDILPVY